MIRLSTEAIDFFYDRVKCQSHKTLLSFCSVKFTTNHRSFLAPVFELVGKGYFNSISIELNEGQFEVVGMLNRDKTIQTLYRNDWILGYLNEEGDLADLWPEFDLLDETNPDRINMKLEE